MRRFTLLLALAGTLMLSVFATTAEAAGNTGWPCGPAYGSYWGQIVWYDAGHKLTCYQPTHSWWIYP